MKITLLILSLFLFVTQQRVQAQSLSQEERKQLLGYFDQSEDALEKAVKGLSAEQLAFKPAPDKWSVAECIEHLAMTEKGILSMVRDQLMKAPANPEMKPAQSPPDEALIKGISGRETKVKTRESMVPTGAFGDAKGALKAFEAAREVTEEYIKKTDDHLSEHYQQSPAGVLNGRQFLVFMSGHTLRHIAQIEEVKADPNFPKK